MIVYPVKIYKPNIDGELEYIETVYPDELSKVYWDNFNKQKGKLNLHSDRKYTKVDSNRANPQNT
tara:strand:+ start:517 stop:711 length:195 start_codon:yes stop_codon:yes gene_type:complete